MQRYLRMVLRAPERKNGLRAVFGHCFGCHHRLAWVADQKETLSGSTYLRSSRPALEAPRIPSNWLGKDTVVPHRSRACRECIHTRFSFRSSSRIGYPMEESV